MMGRNMMGRNFFLLLDEAFIFLPSVFLLINIPAFFSWGRVG
jgi:hypothetical protein